MHHEGACNLPLGDILVLFFLFVNYVYGCLAATERCHWILHRHIIG